MRQRSDADLFQFMFDEQCNARVRFVIEGEFRDVDAFMYEVDLSSDKEPVLVAEGHGDDICEALDDLIEQHNKIGEEGERETPACTARKANGNQCRRKAMHTGRLLCTQHYKLINYRAEVAP